MRFRQRFVERERTLRRGLASRVGVVRPLRVVVAQDVERVGEAAVRERVVGVEVDRLLEVDERLAQPFHRALVPVVAAPQVGLIRLRALGEALREPRFLLSAQLEPERARDLGGHLLLHREDVVHLPVVLIAPELRLGLRVHQLRLDHEHVAALEDAPRHDGARVHVSPDLAGIAMALVPEHDRPRHDAQAR